MRARIGAAAVLAALATVAAILLLRSDQEPAPAEERVATTFPVNGRPMYIECHGAGSPAVILEAGLGVTASVTWADLLPRLVGTTRTCFYERPGLGRSVAAPPPRTSAVMVDELRELLRRAEVAGPYVLVGASFGGLNAQLMAAEHPDDVAGVVLLDSLHPGFDRRFEEVMGRRAAADRARVIGENPEGVRFEDQLESDRQVKVAADAFPPVPLRVLVHSDSFDPGGRPVPRLERLWRELQRDLATLSPRGEVEIVPGTTHRIAEDAPDAVARAIREVAG
jgi:pimeloyl-ACP methyl ester carboxylesterase